MLLARLPPPLRSGSIHLPRSRLTLPGLCSIRSYAASNDQQPHTTTDPKKYAHTLLLPKVSPVSSPHELSKKFANKTMGDLYRWQSENNKGERFVLLDGPPYANGNLHLGHSLNKVLKDIINRYNVLQGRRVEFVPGWDCHGLPIENKALTELGANFHTTEPKAIREAAEKLARRAVETQKQEFELLGVMADWSTEGTYRTIDTKYEVEQLKIFQKMVEKGLIYRHHRPSYWSPSSRTALAEAELTYNDNHRSQSVYVRFDVDKPSKGLQDALNTKLGGAPEIGLVAWTTTAWSLASNQGIMVNSEVEYVAVKRTDGTVLVVAEELLGQLEEIVGTEYEVLAKLPGSSLVGTTYTPLFPSSTSSPSLAVICAPHVTASSGTGLVHCAPAHGAEDYAAYKASIPSSSSSSVSSLRCPIDDDGRFVGVGPGAESLEGMEILKGGGKAIISLGKERGWLLAQKEIRHKYPYDWKSKQPVILRATPQWFANVDGIKEQALAALREVNFVPPSGQSRLEQTVSSRSEWCISRQRTWGVPIPALYLAASPSSGSDSPFLTPDPDAAPILTSESLAHILPILADKGISHWFSAPIEEFLPPSLQGDGKSYVKGTDTMDVWFDSGSAWTQLNPRENDQPRADVVLEGSDQHRGWFQSLLLTCIGAELAQDQKPVAPYGTVITHGFILDGKKNKMSKSDGNVVSPVGVIKGDQSKRGPMKNGLGADALRMWAATADYKSDVSVDDKILITAASRLDRYRRLLRYMLANMDDKTKDIGEYPRDDLSIADRYVLDQLYQYNLKVRKSYETFAFHEVIDQTTLLLNNLSSIYFACSKDALYMERRDHGPRQIIASVFRAALDVITQSLAPITPYLVEDFHSNRIDLPHHKSSEPTVTSAFTRPWLNPPESWNDAEAQVEMIHLMSIQSKVYSLFDQRKGQTVEAHLEICVDSSKIADTLVKHHSILAPLYGVSHVTLLSTPIDEPQPWEYSTSLSTGPDEEAKIGLRIFPSSMSKCPRCWVYSAPRENMLCVRCEGVIRDREVEMGEREEVKPIEG